MNSEELRNMATENAREEFAKPAKAVTIWRTEENAVRFTTQPQSTAAPLVLVVRDSDGTAAMYGLSTEQILRLTVALGEFCKDMEL